MNTTQLSNILNFSFKTKSKNEITKSYSYYQKLTKKCLRYLNNKYYKTIHFIDNEDVLTDIATAIIFADMYHDPLKSSIGYWRIKCIYWQLQNIFNNNKRQTTSLKTELIYNHLPDEELQLIELQQAIEESLDSLDKRDANIITDYYFNNLSQSDIAKKNEISQPRIFQILEYNKKHLQEDLTSFID